MARDVREAAGQREPPRAAPGDDHAQRPGARRVRRLPGASGRERGVVFFDSLSCSLSFGGGGGGEAGFFFFFSDGGGGEAGFFFWGGEAGLFSFFFCFGGGGRQKNPE